MNINVALQKQLYDSITTEGLKSQYGLDSKRASKRTITHKGITFEYNKKRECFIGFSKGKEIMKEIDTWVPIYWISCNNKITNEIDEQRRCGEHELVGIWEDGNNYTCRRCKNNYTIKIILDSKDPRNKLLEKLRNEK